MADNGSYWTKWLVGIITTGLITAISMIGNIVYSNETASRSRDDIIDDKLAKCMQEQTSVNQNILVALAEIKTDLSYLKKAIK
jgi:hypothetical protein